MINADWSTQQLAEFLATVGEAPDAEGAYRAAVQQVSEALEAEVAAVVTDSAVLASVGFPRGEAPHARLLELTEGSSDLHVPGLGSAKAQAVPLEQGSTWLVVARSAAVLDRVETSLFRSMARVLSLVLRTTDLLSIERGLRAKSDEQAELNQNLLETLSERQRLLEKLSRIQSSISHRKPLQEVLDAITSGAVELIGDAVAGFRLVDPDDPNFLMTVATKGVNDEMMTKIKRSPVGQGAGGRALVERRLIVQEDYADSESGLPAFRESGLSAAMAAPVYEEGVAVGSLVVASYKAGRRYSDSEKEALLALADHASLALTDAKTVDAMREAQRAKDLFLAMVSHELKTPLTVIMGTLRTLEKHLDKLDSETRKDMIGAAFARGRELERLIDRLLQGASAELAESSVDVFLPDLIAEGSHGFPRDRLVVVDVPEVVCHVNASAVHRLLGILLENAFSHAPEGSSVEVGARASDTRLEVWVSNEGDLPAGDPALLFEPFHRGEHVSSSGVGLGLYIAARLAISLEGRMDAHQDDGRVCFTVDIPFQRIGTDSVPEGVPAAAKEARLPQ